MNKIDKYLSDTAFEKIPEFKHDFNSKLNAALCVAQHARAFDQPTPSLTFTARLGERAAQRSAIGF